MLFDWPAEELRQLLRNCSIKDVYRPRLLLRLWILQVHRGDQVDVVAVADSLFRELACEKTSAITSSSGGSSTTTSSIEN